MKIETDYWKTDKITPSKIKNLIHNTCESILMDLLYNYETLAIRSNNKGVSLDMSRRHIMKRIGNDPDDDEEWDRIRGRDATRLIIDTLFADPRFPKKLNWATNDIMDAFFDYMGLLSKARREELPYGQSLRYRDNVWERIHNEE